MRPTPSLVDPSPKVWESCAARRATIAGLEPSWPEARVGTPSPLGSSVEAVDISGLSEAVDAATAVDGSADPGAAGAAAFANGSVAPGV